MRTVHVHGAVCLNESFREQSSAGSASPLGDHERTMSSTAAAVPTPTPAPPPLAADAPKPKKICCACPDTRKPRDECVVMNGEDKCAAQIEAHKKCLRSEGFDVRAAVPCLARATL